MYWAEGWNYDYVLLLEQVREADMLREEFSAQTDEEPGSEGNRVGTALDFFDSFASETPALWELMSGPFTSDDRDMNDFVANEDESEDASDGDPRDLFRQQQQQEAERERRESVLAAKRAVRRFQADQSEDEEVQDEASLDEEEVELEEEDPSENEEEEEDDVVGGYAEVESEEEEDDWMQKKRASLEAKRRASRGQPAENGRTKTKGVIAIMDSDDEEDISPRSVAKSKKKKKRIIDDSDEE